MKGHRAHSRKLHLPPLVRWNAPWRLLSQGVTPPGPCGTGLRRQLCRVGRIKHPMSKWVIVLREHSRSLSVPFLTGELSPSTLSTLSLKSPRPRTPGGFPLSLSSQLCQQRGEAGSSLQGCSVAFQEAVCLIQGEILAGQDCGIFSQIHSPTWWS